jgi:hypothetical protein
VYVLNIKEMGIYLDYPVWGRREEFEKCPDPTIYTGKKLVEGNDAVPTIGVSCASAKW